MSLILKEEDGAPIAIGGELGIELRTLTCAKSHSSTGGTIILDQF